MCPQQRKRSGAGQINTTNAIIPSAIQWAFSVGGGLDAMEISVYKIRLRTSLVIQWLRLCSQHRGPRFNP